MDRAVIYARISEDKSGEGMAEKRQVEKCRALADLRGWEVIETIHEAASAYTGKRRKGWSEVLDRIKNDRTDIVIAWHLDRIVRSMTELEELILLCENHDVRIATVSGDIDLSTDVGRMVARILAAVARAEVEMKVRRQRARNLQAAESGLYPSGGRRTFGYLTDGTEHPREAEAVRRAVGDVLHGASLASVASHWSDLGLTPTSGLDKWNYSTIKGILTNPKYAGIRTYEGKVYRGEWTPIITESEHYEVKALFEARSRRAGGNPGGRGVTSLLSVIARCVNGHPMHSGKTNGHPRYRCPRGCATSDKDGADELVTSTLALEVFVNPDSVPAIDLNQNLAEDEELADITRRMNGLAALLGEGGITLQEWQIAREPLARRAQELEGRRQVVQLEGEERAARARDALASLSLEERRAALEAWGARVVFLPRGRGRTHRRPMQHYILMSVAGDGERRVILPGPFEDQQAASVIDAAYEIEEAQPVESE